MGFHNLRWISWINKAPAIAVTLSLYFCCSALPLFGKTKSENGEYVIQKNAYLEFQLEATSDLEGDLQYEILTQPANGILEGTAPNLTYIPDDDYQGIEEIRFKATDSSQEGNPAIIRIQVGSSSNIPTLKEEFITLKITKTLGSRFWKVMMDGEERPYLEIQETSHKWLDIVASCDEEEQRCTLKLHQLNKTYHIDGKNLTFEEEEEGEEQKLPVGAFIVQKGKFWLRYDLWEQWIPLKASWNLDQYFLNFRPSYPLLADLKNKRKIAWQMALLRQEQAKKLDMLDILQPESGLNAEMRFQVMTQSAQNPSSSKNLLGFDISSEIYGGTLLLSGSTLQEEFAGPPAVSSTTSQSTWNYQLLHQEYFDLLEAGSFLAPGGGLFPHSIVTNGFRVKRKPEVVRTQNDLVLRGQSLPNTEIALYRGGFLLEIQQAKADGSYEFASLKYAGGEQLRLKFYYPDGSTSEEALPMAIDQGFLLPEGEWDAQFFTGEYNLERFHWINFGYAPSDYFTAGITLYQFPSDWALLQDSNLIKLNAAYRPFWGAIFFGEVASHKNGMDMSLQADLTWLTPHFIRLTQTNIHPQSPILNYLDIDRHRESITELYHSVSWASWNWQSELQQDELEQLLRMTVRRHLTSAISVSLLGEQTADQVTSLNTQRSELTADYVKGNHTVHTAVGTQTLGTSFSASYRYQGRGEMPYDIRAAYSKPPTTEGLTTLSISWRPHRNITVDAISGPGDASSLALSYHDILAPEIGAKKYEDFGKGTLTGYVFYPDGATPMPGIVVQAGSNRGVTDDTGRYIIPGLPAEQNIQVTVVGSSLEVGTATVDTVKMIRFRPTTTLEYNPRMTRAIGFDGMVIGNIETIGALRLEIFSVKEMKKIAETIVEEDGFFVVENIPPGKYQLRLKGLDKPQKPILLELAEGEIWVSDVKLTLR